MQIHSDHLKTSQSLLLSYMCREVVNRRSECFANVTHPALLLLGWSREGEGGGRGRGREEREGRSEVREGWKRQMERGREREGERREQGREGGKEERKQNKTKGGNGGKARERKKRECHLVSWGSLVHGPMM